MAGRTERYLLVYFRLLGLTCSARRRSTQRLLVAYVGMILGDMAVQFAKYFGGRWKINDFDIKAHQQVDFFVRVIDAMSVAYLVSHMIMVTLSLHFRNRERLLMTQLPPIGKGVPLWHIRFLLIIECGVGLSAIVYGFVTGISMKQMIANVRYLFTTQAVRGRSLQVTLLVLRLDGRLQTLEQQLSNGERSRLEMRSCYAHMVRLAQSISRLYGFSLLLMNVLCIGDFIMVCYAFIVFSEIADTNISWVLFWQAMYVLLPTLMKISTLCATCQRSAKRTEHLTRLVNTATQETRAQCGLDIPNSCGQANEFMLQIMQNPIQFDVCGIYQLNLPTLAAIFLFIVQSLVIFMQFVVLVKQYDGD